MKLIFNKIFRSASAVLIAGILVAGIAYAQASCCRMMNAVCIQASDRSLGRDSVEIFCRLPASHVRISPSDGAHKFEQSNTRHGDAPSCCEQNRCDPATTWVCLPASSLQPISAIGKDVKIILSEKETPLQAELKRGPPLVYARQIYILTQSIIC